MAQLPELDTVVVTGSRIRRAESEGPAPVTVITAEDIKQQGATTVYEALSTLTQFSGTVQNELSTNGFTPNASAINLRDLGPGRTLVLVNGRRVAEYPLPYNGVSNFVNLASIPAAAVERIEVLSGGASAIYGSDAVAGVINVITRNHYQGDDFSARLGTTTRGGGGTTDLQWVGGRAGAGWSLTYGLEYLRRDPIYAYQRSFMDSRLDSPDPATRTPIGGLQLLDGFTSQYIDITQGGTCDRFGGHFSVRTTAAGSRCGQYDFPAFTTIRGAHSNPSLYVSGEYQLDGGARLFGMINAWRSDARYASGLQYWTGPSSGLFYDPTRDTLLSVQRIFQVEETGANALDVHSSEQSWNWTAGVRGSLLDHRFEYEFAAGQSAYSTDQRFNRLITGKVNDYFLGPQQGYDPYFDYYPTYTLNLARYIAPLTPPQFAAISTTLDASGHSQADQVSLTINGDLRQLPAGPLGFAAVLEWSNQQYRLSPDPRSLPTATPETASYNYSDTGGGGKRGRYALGTEFRVPLANRLKASLAARYDKYNDITQVGGATTWNAGLEWRPMQRLLIRGTYATSFRAPDMHYVFADPSGFYHGVFDEYRCRLNNGNNYAACQVLEQSQDNPDYSYTPAGSRSGNLNLKEEKGKSWTAGFVWEPRDGLSVQADYYDIRISNGVSDLDTAYLLRNEADCRLGVDRSGKPVNRNSTQCQQFIGLVQRISSPASSINNMIASYQLYPVNSAIELTRGIDARAGYRVDTQLGKFEASLSWSHTLAYSYTQYQEDGPLADHARDSPSNFDFRSRMAASLAWQRDRWAGNVHVTDLGSLPNWAGTGRIGSYVLWNMNLSRTFAGKATVGLYVNNVFDTLHPRDDTYNSYPYFWSAYSPVGREVFLQLDYTLH